jgi:hypothetical protein
MKNSFRTDTHYKNLVTHWNLAQEMQEEIEVEMAIHNVLHKKTPLTAKAVEAEIERLAMTEDRKIANRIPKKLSNANWVAKKLKNLKSYEKKLKSAEISLNNTRNQIKIDHNILSDERVGELATQKHNLRRRAEKLHDLERLVARAEAMLAYSHVESGNGAEVKKAQKKANKSEATSAKVAPTVKSTHTSKILKKRAVAKAGKKRTQADIDKSKLTRKKKQVVANTRSVPNYH